MALVLGIEVLDQHEGHAGVLRQVGQQLAEGFQAAGGGADPDDRKGGEETIDRLVFRQGRAVEESHGGRFQP